jgi:phenylacetaldehyde dehydrogenase
MAAMKLGPVLASGCTTVLKPAENTPLTALRMGELLMETGIPEGVVNILPGYGGIAGEALVHHPDVDKIVFTGSTAVGMKIIREAGLKRVTLELGGKSPMIVLNDADIDLAINLAILAININSG